MEIHPIGVGTWTVSEADVPALQYSLSKGQNHIDTAEMYGSGEAETAVGAAIKGAKREDLFVASKVWKTNVGIGKVRPAVEAMLERLGTDYLDLLYIHAPWFDAPWREAIPQINDLIDAGLVRHFGVSNFTVDDMSETAASSKHPVMANQMHYNVLYKDEVDEAFRKYCTENNIKIVAHTPLVKGIIDNSVVIEVAKAHNATPYQVALAWCLAKGTLPVPKSTDKSHVDQNLGTLDIKLTDQEMVQLDRL